MNLEQARQFFLKDMNYVPETRPSKVHFLISKSMKLLASISSFYTISTWNLLKNKFLFEFPYKTSSPPSTAFSEDDKFLIISSQTQLNFLDLKQKQITLKLEISSRVLKILDFSSQNHLLCITSDSRLLTIEKTSYSIKYHQLKKNTSCMIDDDNFVYFGGTSRYIEKLCLTKNELIENVCTKSIRITCLCLTQDKQFLIAGEDRDKVIIIRTSNLKLEKIISFQCKSIKSVVSFDNKILVSRSRNENTEDSCTLLQFDLTTEDHHIINLLNFTEYHPILLCEFLNSLIYLDQEGNIRKFDLITRKVSMMFSRHSIRFESICFDEDEGILYTGGVNGLIQVWDVNKKVLIKVLDEHSCSVTCLFLMKNQRILASGSAFNEIFLWDLEKNFTIAKFSVNYSDLKDFTGAIYDLNLPDEAFFNENLKGFTQGVDCRFLISFSRYQVLSIFDVVRKKLVERIFIQDDCTVSFKRVKNSRFHIEMFSARNELKFRIWKDLGC